MSEVKAIQRSVKVIPATFNHTTLTPITGIKKRRVAAYARVSTDSEEQLTSYEAQVDYYTRYIHGKDEWTFVEIYADEGISATNTKRRDGFKRMIADALNGKIDLIITKSVSRFARNTVDTLTAVRQLKEKGVEVFFEKENIYTLDSKGELLITIMSSLAQEESRSISENVTWGQRKRFSDGKVSLPYKHFMGYCKGKNGLPEIVEEEAAIVRRIYSLYLEGKSPAAIARLLTEEGIATPGGKVNWRPNAVISILTNEKYKGDALLQKKFTVDFLNKKQKINEGEVPQYYVQNSHPAIIRPEIFDIVQDELNRRKSDGHRTVTPHYFSGKIFCGECGALFGSKVIHSTDRYKTTVWGCNGKHRGNACTMHYLREDAIQQSFIQAMNQIISNKADIVSEYKIIIRELMDTKKLDMGASQVQAEMDIALELLQKCVMENAHTALDQEDYQQRYDRYSERYNSARFRLAEINEQRQSTAIRKVKAVTFLDILEKGDGLIQDFNPSMWYTLVERVTILSNTQLRFHLHSGLHVQIGS